MNLSDIHTLYAYNRWANESMFAVLDTLTEQQFTTELPSSFPSIRETVFHILFAEWLWLKRWQGASPRSTLSNPDGSLATWETLTPGGTPSASELATLAGLRSFADSIDRERSEFLGRLSEDVLQAPLQFRDMAGNPYVEPLVNLMQHVANHSSYHRGQVTTLLRQLGAETVALDMIYFFRASGEKAAGAQS
jgi:uncharacterized damage-inducible protein DinB